MKNEKKICPLCNKGLMGMDIEPLKQAIVSRIGGLKVNDESTLKFIFEGVCPYCKSPSCDARQRNP